MPRKKPTEKELEARAKKFTAEDEDIRFIKGKDWKPEKHPEQEQE